MSVANPDHPKHDVAINVYKQATADAREQIEKWHEANDEKARLQEERSAGRVQQTSDLFCSRKVLFLLLTRGQWT
jgi:hypothetical protein